MDLGSCTRAKSQLSEYQDWQGILSGMSIRFDVPEQMETGDADCEIASRNSKSIDRERYSSKFKS